MSNDAENVFLGEGVKRYVHALATVREFESIFARRLDSALLEYGSDAIQSRGAEMGAYASTKPFEPWMCATRNVLLVSKQLPLVLELGVWWKDGGVAYYCGLIDEHKKAYEFQYTSKHPRVEFAKWSKKPRLFITPSLDPAAAIEDDFTLVLDELMKSVK